MLRPAQVTDAGLIVSIRKRAILAQPETFWNKSQLKKAANHYSEDYIITNFGAHTCHIYEDKAFVAYAQNYLASLFILPEAQGNGLGLKLLQHAENDISKNHDSIWLFAHPYAEKFYERHGFIRQKEKEEPFGFPLYKYLKSF